MKKRLRLVLTLVLASFAVSLGAYYELHRDVQGVRFDTAPVSRGDLVASVICTGTLQAVTTVEVTTQANGVVKQLNADFNSVVHKGEVLARLDPTLIEAQLQQGAANVEKAKADVARLQVAVEDANRQLQRALALAGRQLLDASDLETAQVAAQEAVADLHAAQAQVAEAQAMVDQNRIALGYTVIASPVDGIVIARNVDVGQTVVSNMQAQTLFEIAGDLTKMQLVATVDESDIGRVHEGDAVRFTVDAYPDETFTGTVRQVRVNPEVEQNVVTYDTVITVPNVDLKLRPGMTANVNVRVASRQDVTRVPANALLFKPYDELFAALHQPIPAARQLAPARSAVPGKPGIVWVFRDHRLQPVPVTVGLSDGTNAELIAGHLQAGDAVVLNARQ